MGINIEPKFSKDNPWDLVCYRDSNYAYDTNSQRRLSRYILFVKGMHICCTLKAQRRITLLSYKSELIFLSEALKEIMFVIQLLKSIKINVNLKIIVRVDNVEAIFMSNNFTTASHTKNIYINTKNVNGYVEDVVIKINIFQVRRQHKRYHEKCNGGIYSKHAENLIKAYI